MLSDEATETTRICTKFLSLTKRLKLQKAIEYNLFEEKMTEPPVKVSPLIKLGRWSMLTAGIFYGAYHQKRLSAQEALNREKEAKVKAERDLVLAEERRRAREEEMHALAILSKPRGTSH